MKIAIHHREGGFSGRWIKYCEKNGIDYKIVNAYDSDIVEQLEDCDAFMWHHHHGDYRDCLFAKQLIFSLENAGKSVFPSSNTTWHFDDKVGQKYLLESIKAPLVPSYVFYTKEEALGWLGRTSFPKVFKLRGGAGARNVKLVKNYHEGKKLINKAFGKGFPPFDRIGNLKERFNNWRNGHDTLFGVCKGIGRLFISTEMAKMHACEKGYVYFQDFIPNNKFDLRVCVIGDKAFAIKRLTREHDFRASGSGMLVYDKSQIDERTVKIAFEINKKLKCQSIAYDFVLDEQNNPMIVEISYGYSVEAYDYCEGYWTNDMQWHGGSHFDFCGWMVEDLLNK